MFGNKMNLNMDKYLSTGSYLTIEEQLVLQTSLPVLQMENRFSSVVFHAKILGINSDYYIAFGRGKDFIRNKMFFYSLDGQSWKFLFPPSDDVLSYFRRTRNRFTGDPTHVHRLQLGEKKIVMREDLRLAAAVHLLDWETTIGPRGALQIDPVTGIVKENPYFEGLEGLLCSYVHHRLPKNQESFVATKRLCPAAGDAGVEFLESIEEDYPPGEVVPLDANTVSHSRCWMLRDDPVHRVVRLHSLWWPGHCFYYCKNTGIYNSLYIGLGDRNEDLPYINL